MTRNSLLDSIYFLIFLLLVLGTTTHSLYIYIMCVCVCVCLLKFISGVVIIIDTIIMHNAYTNSKHFSRAVYNFAFIRIFGGLI